MRSRYKAREANGRYFVTSTIVGWLPVFTTEEAAGTRGEGGWASSGVLRHSRGVVRLLPPAQRAETPRVGCHGKPLPRHRVRAGFVARAGRLEEVHRAA